MKRLLVLELLGVLMVGCSQEYSVTVSDDNLSDSYIQGVVLSVNGYSVPVSLSPCANGLSTSSLATVYSKRRPEFVLVEWEHILSKKYYRAKVPLDERTGEWLRNPPFPKSVVGERTPTLIVQWRGPNRVAVMMVANPMDFSSAWRDVGEALGEEIPKPEYAPNQEVTYDTLQPKPGDGYFPGDIEDYDRTYDGALTWEQRFGCPRGADGKVDVSRLPPAKLPFLTGADGEYIPCDEYFCGDKQALIQELRPMGRLNYPLDSKPPKITFRDAPHPKPAW